jgi:uncharacterized protein YbaP (TraB family)
MAAPDTATSAAPARAPVAPLHPALWKITRGGTTIWLFGTIHMLPAGANWLTGPVAQAADSADEIATEIDDPAGTATRASLAARSLLPAGEHLSALLPDDENTAMTERLARFGLGAKQLDPDKPWYAAVALSTLPLLRRGFDSRNGVEAGLNAREAGRSLRHTGIETPDGQLAILDGLPQASQLAYLKNVIDDFDTIDGEIDAMVAAWGKGDAATLARIMNENEGKDDPLLTQRLILDRNVGFAAWIAQRLSKPGTVFMAIGAGHLAGAGSVQAVLAKSGVHVERVQ